MLFLGRDPLSKLSKHKCTEIYLIIQGWFFFLFPGLTFQGGLQSDAGTMALMIVPNFDLYVVIFQACESINSIDTK